MNRQELEKIVKPLEWAEHNGGRVVRADTFLHYNLRLERVEEEYIVYREEYPCDTYPEYDKPVSLEAAKEIGWAKYLDTIKKILKDPSEEECE